jgi:NADH-quinone oxidoreductase subunit L
MLIAFFHERTNALKAALRAFTTYRICDVGLLAAGVMIHRAVGSGDFERLFGGVWPNAHSLVSPGNATLVSLLLVFAAMGKSAQVPFSNWLPRAMEGPTPASALIHAATMVTAGIYLITRSAPLFVGCPGALAMVSIVGATTALVAALIATVQNDLKRVLAYSTISQLGYMFVALGTGTMLGFTAAIFHLVTHAFFKALLFLGAGSVMHAMGGVIDMRRFGGLRHVMPITAATFLVGACALAGVPPFAGFFSKDEILATLHAKAHPEAHGSDHAEAGSAGERPRDSSGQLGVAAPRPFRPASMTTRLARRGFTGEHGSTTEKVGLDALDHPSTWRLLFWMSLLTAGLTAFYTFRAVFMTFTGPIRVPKEAGHHAHESPPAMTTPLLVLAVLSAFSGVVLFVTNALSSFLAATPSLTASAVARTAVPHVFHWDIAIQGTLAAAIGIAVAAIGHLGRRSDSPQMERYLGPLGTLFANKFYFDQIYAALIVKPLEVLAMVTAFFDRAIVDGTVDAIGQVPLAWGSAIRRMQSGLVQRYALAGVVGVLAIVLALAWQLRP